MPSICSILDDAERLRKGLFTRKQGRAYNRIMSGLVRSEKRQMKVFFLTLTSSDEIASESPGRDGLLNAHWNVFLKRFRRMWGDIEYYAVRTTEGNGVIHALFRFDKGLDPMVNLEHYLITGALHAWCSVTWEEIHKSPIVWINGTYGTKARKARYLVQYLAIQKKAVETRISSSSRWIFRGAVGKWNSLKRQFLRLKGLRWCVVIWNAILGATDPGRIYIQKTLECFFKKET